MHNALCAPSNVNIAAAACRTQIEPARPREAEPARQGPDGGRANLQIKNENSGQPKLNKGGRGELLA